MEQIRILLIEDNRILREGILDMINEETDIKVVGISSHTENALRRARMLKPHMILLDLDMRNENALHSAALVRKEFPSLKLIGMGLMPTRTDIFDLVKAGASGFILKDASVDEFLRTIRLVAQGVKVLPPPLTGSLFSYIVEHAMRKGKGKERLLDEVRITRREGEIMALIAENLSNKEIAERLNIAMYTVKSHVHNILEKFEMRSRFELAAFAREDNFRGRSLLLTDEQKQ